MAVLAVLPDSAIREGCDKTCREGGMASCNFVGCNFTDGSIATVSGVRPDEAEGGADAERLDRVEPAP